MNDQKKLQPVLVKRLRFVGPTDGPGLSVASNVAGSEPPKGGERRNQRWWLLEHLPWLRAFRITHHAPGGEVQGPEYVPEHRVAGWEYFELS